MSPNPPCRAYGKADAIIDARVLEFTKVKSDTSLHLRRRAKVKIKNTYKGTLEGLTYIYTGDGDSDCGFRFKVGKRYLIFANRDEGFLTTSSCSNNDLIKNSQDYVSYFQKRSTLPPGATIYGRVEQRSESGTLSPLAGIRIEIDGPEKLSLETDAEGSFAKGALPVGHYSVRATPPVGFSVSTLGSLIYSEMPLYEDDIPDKGCIEANFLLLELKR